MTKRTWLLVAIVYAVTLAISSKLSAMPKAVLLGAGLGAGLMTGVSGIFMVRSHRHWKEQAELTDQAIELCKTLLVQRDEVKAKLDDAVDLIQRYIEQRHGEGEEWKNG